MIRQIQETSSNIVRVIYTDQQGRVRSLTRQGKSLKTRKAKKSSQLRRPGRTKAKLVRKKKRKPKQVVEAALVPAPVVVDDYADDYVDYVDYVYEYDDYGDYGAGPVRSKGTVYCVLCTVYYVLCTVYCVLCTTNVTFSCSSSSSPPSSCRGQSGGACVRSV